MDGLQTLPLGVSRGEISIDIPRTLAQRSLTQS